jgi:ribonucleoside-diphosphate reductase alpha chain
MSTVIEPNARARAADPGLNARRVISKRYSLKDAAGHPLEDWEAVVRRVVTHVCMAEPEGPKRDDFYSALTGIMLRREFVPNTPCLVNAGKPGGMLAACFVLPVEDSIAGIMKTVTDAALVHQQGGGTGFTFEKIRPAGSVVRSTHGVASGPVSFMNIFNTTTDTVKQGGVRRGANMGILRCTHPDLLRFIHAKNDQHSLTNFNISVTVTDAFFEAVNSREWTEQWFQLSFEGNAWTEPVHDPVQDGPYCLYMLDGAPLTFRDRAAFLKAEESGLLAKCSKVEPPRPGMIHAPDLWNRIIASAHAYAEPGVIFIDEVNRHNLLMASMGPKLATNPCAEEALHANNSCNLGSIDLAKFYSPETRVDWEGLAETTRWCVRFLDNVVDTCAWPLDEIDDVVKRTRPVGLGVMGFADLFLLNEITYGSDESIDLIGEVMSFVRREAWAESCRLGAEKGVFPEYHPNRAAYDRFLREVIGLPEAIPLTPRNYEVTTIAPTGTISLVAETSSGIEPNFDWAYVREDTIGKRTYVHTLAAQALGLEVDQTDQESIDRAAAFVVENQGKLPPHFISAMSVTAERHVRVLAAAQAHVDNGVSKTCNGARDDTVESVDELYRLARELGCKAVSYYRDGSRESQVLTAVKTVQEEPPTFDERPVTSAPASLDRSPDRADRPKELTGATWQIPFDGQNLYVTVNHDGHDILEVFVTGPVSSSVGKLASKMLRGGFNVREVARVFDTTTGTHSAWFNERLLTSPEQAIAECLMIQQRRLENKPDSAKASEDFPAPRDSVGAAPAAHHAGVCPDCSGNLKRASGCSFCESCGWSKC